MGYINGRFLKNLSSCESILNSYKFVPSKEYVLEHPVYGPMTKVILDYQHHWIAFLFTGFVALSVVHYGEVISSEVLASSGSRKQHGVGNAVLGGVLFGPAGAIIGHNASKATGTIEDIRLKVVTTNEKTPLILMKFMKEPMDSKSETAKRVLGFCEQVNAVLQGIIYQNQGRR